MKTAGGIVEVSKFSELLSNALLDDESFLIDTIKASICASIDKDAAVERFQIECRKLNKKENRALVFWKKTLKTQNKKTEN